ncbi:MAG: DHA2 family efflux MFS transporter permease subunit [Alphaproteobacteria bacterium]|nr:DHA2 family efflux MFS transporter permease subunit [Alphaproteobacteria bacterium]
MSPAGEGPVVNRSLITISIMLATLMQALDTTIANVALPDMQGSFAVAQDQVAWVLTSYIVAAAVATPLCGWLAMRYGRKWLFLVSVAGFTVASGLCGLAGSLAQMVIYRLLQGIFGAALVPLSQAVLLDTNPREKHGQAMALWGAGIMLGPILGPTLGGWLTDTYNWRWVFYINLPVGILCFLGLLLFLHETPTSRSRPFDFFGFVMLSIAVGAAQMMLDRGELKDWFGATEIRVYFGLIVAAFWVFVMWTAMADHPFFNRALLKDRNFVAGCIFIAVIGVVLYGTLALLPPFLQTLMEYPTVTTGLLLAPRGVATMIGMLIVGRLSGKVDTRLMLLFGFGATSYSLWQMSHFDLQMDWWPVVTTGLVQGFGLGFLFVPLTTIAFTTLDPRLRTEAAGIFSLIRNVGASIGISFVETELARGIQVSHQSFAAVMTPFNRALTNPQVQAYWNIHDTAGLAALNAEVNRQAVMQAYINDFMLIMLIALASVPLLFLLRKAKPPPGAAPALE